MFLGTVSSVMALLYSNGLMSENGNDHAHHSLDVLFWGIAFILSSVSLFSLWRHHRQNHDAGAKLLTAFWRWLRLGSVSCALMAWAWVAVVLMINMPSIWLVFSGALLVFSHISALRSSKQKQDQNKNCGCAHS